MSKRPRSSPRRRTPRRCRAPFRSARAPGPEDPGGRRRASPRRRRRPSGRSPRPTARASDADPRPARTPLPIRPRGSGGAPRSSSASRRDSKERGGRSLAVRSVGRLASVQPVEEGVPQRLAAHLQLVARPPRLDLDDLHQAGVVAVRAPIRLGFADLVKPDVGPPAEEAHRERLVPRQVMLPRFWSS